MKYFQLIDKLNSGEIILKKDDGYLDQNCYDDQLSLGR